MDAETLAAHDLERDRRRTLARFLLTDEDGAAMWADKVPAEPELFRAGRGRCDRCQAPDEVLHRFEPDERHVGLLYCQCEGYDERWATKKEWICVRHAAGIHPRAFFGETVECDLESEPGRDDSCILRWWLSEQGHMPWLCPHCWKWLVEAELEHLAAGDADG